MAIVCPRCAAPTVLSAELVHSAGRMLRCTHCAMFVKVGGGSLQFAARRTGRPRFERIVEHRPALSRQDTASRSGTEHRAGKPSVSGRPIVARRLFGAWLGAVAAVAVCGLAIALVFQSAVVGASPAAETAQFAGLEIRLVRSAVERLQIGNAVVVEGEISNRSDKEISVPAVRIAVLSNGVERHIWLHEPQETRLVAGDSIRFRSVLTEPPAGIDEVAFRLTARPDAAVRMN